MLGLICSPGDDDRPSFTKNEAPELARVPSKGRPSLVCEVSQGRSVVLLYVPTSNYYTLVGNRLRACRVSPSWLSQADESDLMPTSGPPGVARLDSSWPLGRPSSPLRRPWTNPTTPHARIIETPTRRDMDLPATRPLPDAFLARVLG